MIKIIQDADLSRLLDHLKGLDYCAHVKVYYDPKNWVFHLHIGFPNDKPPPPGCSVISFGTPGQFITNIHRILNNHFKGNAE